jgi:hypothetical protein
MQVHHTSYTHIPRGISLITRLSLCLILILIKGVLYTRYRYAATIVYLLVVFFFFSLLYGIYTYMLWHIHCTMSLCSKPGVLRNRRWCYYYTSILLFAFLEAGPASYLGVCFRFLPALLAEGPCSPAPVPAPPTFLCSAPPCSVQLSQNQSLSGGALTGGTKQNIWNPLSHPFPFPSPHSSICGAFSHPRHISHLVRKILAVRHESIPSH